MRQAGLSKAFTPLLLVVVIGLVVVLQFGFIFLLIATLPALVAFYIDHERGKPTFQIVAACNVAATLPSIAPMLHYAIHFKHYDVSSLLGDMRIWLFVYCGAAAGWCLIYLCRFVARFIVTLMYEYNIISLELQQKQLIEEWGQQVKQPPV